METALADRIATRRGVGQIVVGRVRRDEASPIGAADAAAMQVGALPIGSAWNPLEEVPARAMIKNIIAFDLAYKARCMPEEDAARLAEEFISLVTGPAEYFTNIGAGWSVERDGISLTGHTLWPLTNATFSVGVAIVSDREAVLLVVSDED